MNQSTIINRIASTLLVSMIFIISVCSSMSVSVRETKRKQLDETAIAGLVKRDETLQKELDDSLGYAVANMKVTKVPIVGAGGGEGV